MQSSAPRFQKHLFVCENRRDGGKACCAGRGSENLRELLKNAVKAKGLDKSVRVSRSGCLDVCSEGPNVLLMPDNIWFSHVTEQDLDKILEKAAS